MTNDKRIIHIWDNVPKTPRRNGGEHVSSRLPESFPFAMPSRIFRSGRVRRSSCVLATLSLLFCTVSAYPSEPAQRRPAIVPAIDWNNVIAVSKTTPTILASPFRPLAGVTPQTSTLQDLEFQILKDLSANYVRWHLIDPSRHVVEMYPPTKTNTSWDFSRLDADLVRFLEATRGRDPIVNITMIPYWMFSASGPVPAPSDAADPALLREKYSEVMTKDLTDPSGKAVGDYFARIASWYTKGGFTDEAGVFHKSGHHYDLPWWGVLNEPDQMGGITPAQYTHLYDAIVSGVREVSPTTKFVGLSLGVPSVVPEYFEYFLDPKNHRSGIPLDMIGYHFYAGAVGLGGASENEQISHWQYTFFDQAAAFLSTVRYVEQIRKRLSPSTRVNMDEIGGFLADDLVSDGKPAIAKPVPALYWNLNASIFAYLYAQLARMEVDVATLSGIYDRPHGLPGHKPSITFIDPQTANVRAPIRALRLITANLGPGDKLVATADTADFVGSWHPEFARSDVMLQAFVTKKGRRLLVINKRMHDVKVSLKGLGSIENIEVVDQQSGSAPSRSLEAKDTVVTLSAFAVAMVRLGS